MHKKPREVWNRRRVNDIETLDRMENEASLGPPPGLPRKPKRKVESDSSAGRSSSDVSDSVLMSGKPKKESFSSMIDTSQRALDEALRMHSQRVEDDEREIKDYFYQPKEWNKRRMNEKDWKDVYIFFCFSFPLLLVFAFEYFLGTEVATWLGIITHSRSLVFLELVQNIPLIVNLRHYKIAGDVDDVSCYVHIYFHLVSAYSANTSQQVLIHLVLTAQQMYIVNLLWDYLHFKATTCRKVAEKSTFFMFALLAFDKTLASLFASNFLNGVFRGIVLVLLQLIRYFPQISTNSKVKHCAVESVESHVIALFPALARIYIGLQTGDLTAIIGYSVALFSNLNLAYQITIYFEESVAYIEREIYLESKLPKTVEKMPRRSVSLKFKPGLARASFGDFPESLDGSTVFSGHGPESELQMSPMM